MSPRLPAFFFLIWVLVSFPLHAAVQLALPNGYTAGTGFQSAFHRAFRSLARSPNPKLQALYRRFEGHRGVIKLTPGPDGAPPRLKVHPKTGATQISLPADCLDPARPCFRRGGWVATLFLASDHARGKPHPSSSVRQRRAEFIRQLWQDWYGYGEKAEGEGKKPSDYQVARKAGAVDAVFKALLAGNDFPELPKQGTPKR